MKTKKIVSLILAFILAFTMLPLSAITSYAASASRSAMTGRGTEKNPYKIWDAKGWARFIVTSYDKSYAGEYVELAADIDLTYLCDYMLEEAEKTTYFTGTAQKPATDHKYLAVGGNPNVGFEGSFDGKGYTISNFTVLADGSGGNGVALFGRLKNNAKIANLNVKDCMVQQIQAHGRTILAADVVSGIGTVVIENVNIKNCIAMPATEAGSRAAPAGVIGIVYGGSLKMKNVIIDECVFINNVSNIGVVGRMAKGSSGTYTYPKIEMDNVDVRNTMYVSMMYNTNYKSLRNPVNIGGLIGGWTTSSDTTISSTCTFNTDIKNCDVAINVILPFAPSAIKEFGIGGIIGYADAYTEIGISKCTADVNVFYNYTDPVDPAYAAIGGIVGIARGNVDITDTEAVLCLETSTAYNTVSPMSIYAGGIDGYSEVSLHNDTQKSELYIIDTDIKGLSSFLNLSYSDYLNINGVRKKGEPCVSFDSRTYAALVKAGAGIGTKDYPFIIDTQEKWEAYIRAYLLCPFENIYMKIDPSTNEPVMNTTAKEIEFDEVDVAPIIEYLNEFNESYSAFFTPPTTYASFDGELCIKIFPFLDDLLYTILENSSAEGWGMTFNDGAPVLPNEFFETVSYSFNAKDIDTPVSCKLAIFTSSSEYIVLDEAIEFVPSECIKDSYDADYSDDLTKNYITELLNYTTSAKAFFENQTVSASTSKVDYEDVEDVLVTGSSEKIVFKGTSLTLEGKTSLNFFFRLAEGTDSTDGISAKIGNFDADINNLGNGWYSVSAKNITADNLDEKFKVTIDGLVITASVLSYCKATQKLDNDDLKNLANSIANFNVAAKDYLD